MFGMWSITRSITHGLSCSAERVMEESMKCVARWKVGCQSARDPHGNTLVMVACAKWSKTNRQVGDEIQRGAELAK